MPSEAMTEDAKLADEPIMTTRKERIAIAHEAYDRVVDQDVGMGTIIEAVVDALAREEIQPGMRCEGFKIDPKAVCDANLEVSREADFAAGYSAGQSAGAIDSDHSWAWAEYKIKALRTQPNATSAREDALREAAQVGYRACAETRHVSLGQRVELAILALIDNPTGGESHEG